MKYLDFYNSIFKKNNLKGYIAFGESINNGSFLGGLSKFILKNTDIKVFNCTNAEYTHIGIGFGIALGGGKAIYVCKQIDFLFLGFDHFISTNEVFKMNSSKGNFNIITAIQDQGYQGPQSSFYKLKAFSNLVGLDVIYLNSMNAFYYASSIFNNNNAKIFILSQMLININPSLDFSNLENTKILLNNGFEIINDNNIHSISILCLGFSYFYLQNYFYINKINICKIRIINVFSNKVDINFILSNFDIDLILDDDEDNQTYTSSIPSINNKKRIYNSVDINNFNSILNLKLKFYLDAL